MVIFYKKWIKKSNDIQLTKKGSWTIEKWKLIHPPRFSLTCFIPICWAQYTCTMHVHVHHACNISTLCRGTVHQNKTDTPFLLGLMGRLVAGTACIVFGNTIHYCITKPHDWVALAKPRHLLKLGLCIDITHECRPPTPHSSGCVLTSRTSVVPQHLIARSRQAAQYSKNSSSLLMHISKICTFRPFCILVIRQPGQIFYSTRLSNS